MKSRTTGLMAAAMLLAAAGNDLAAFGASRRITPLRPDPPGAGRHAEKDAEALSKAQAKRDRKAAKRAADVAGREA